jgi:hypothetical protein
MRFPPRSGLNFIDFLSFLRHWVITFGIRAQGLGVSLLHLRHLGIFAITFLYDVSEETPWRIFSIHIKVCGVKISAPEGLTLL